MSNTSNIAPSIQFDAADFADKTRLFCNASSNAEGKGNDYARPAIAALMLGTMSELTLAVSLYDEFKPLTAKGKLAEPSENSKGVVSVSSIRNAKGGINARSVFDSVTFVARSMGTVSDACDTSITAFVMGNRETLNGLVKAIKAEKSAIAKAAAAAMPKSDIEPEAVNETEVEAVNHVAQFAAYLDGLDVATIDAMTQVGLASILGKLVSIGDAIADNAKVAING